MYRRLISFCVLLTLILLAAAPVQAASPPVVRIDIPVMGLTADVLAVSELLALPDGGATWDLAVIGDQVGWLDPALYPQAGPGNLVLAGHRTLADGAPGAFYSLAKLDYGDFITVLRSDGLTMSYRVVETRLVDDNDMTVVEDSGDGRLTLITCTAEPGYAHRWVVVAEPLGQVVCRNLDGDFVPCIE